jgi:ATP-binding cassette subfamily B protein
MGNKKNELLHMLIDFAGGTKRYFFIAVSASALSILFSFLMPHVVGFTVDSVIGDKSAALPDFLTPLYGKIGGRGYLRDHFIL